jgi:hypothetical protein
MRSRTPAAIASINSGLGLKDAVRRSRDGGAILIENLRLTMLAAFVVALALGLTGCGSTPVTASKPVDIRGTWDMVAIAGTSQYPQTMRITSEDFSTGALAGTDAGAGLTFTVVGSITGADATFTTTNAGYTSHSKATVSRSGGTLTMSGTFTDSNKTSGTFTAQRTAVPL